MKILGIIASPRKLGNSEVAVKEILNTLPAEWEKDILNIASLDIKPCKACYACLSQGRECILEDDLKLFLEKLRWADRVVIAGPVYFLGEQTNVKLISDRLISILNEGDRYFTNKPCVIAVTHAIANWEGYAREAMLNFTRVIGLNPLGIRVFNKMLPGDIADASGKDELHALAKALKEDEPLLEQDPDRICCPVCQSSLVQLRRDKGWHCVMCGASGKLTEDDLGLVLTPELQEYTRFSAEGIAHHGKVLLGVSQVFRERRKEVIENLKPYK